MRKLMLVVVALAAWAARAADVSKLLSDEKKVVAYLKYSKVLAVGVDGVGAAALSSATLDGGALEVKGDAMGDLASTASKAMKESGLTQEEIAAFTSALTLYFTKRSLVPDAKKGLARYADMPGMVKLFQKQLDDAEQARVELGRQHGAAALANVDKYEPQFLAAQDEMLRRTLTPKKKK